MNMKESLRKCLKLEDEGVEIVGEGPARRNGRVRGCMEGEVVQNNDSVLERR